MYRKIRFRRAHFVNGKFQRFSYWGPVEGGFEVPASISGCDSYIDEQFTGLQDKNGKEIYEGDIITDNIGSDGVVKWSQGDCSFSVHYYSCDLFESLYIDHQNFLEITGNIHDK